MEPVEDFYDRFSEFYAETIPADEKALKGNRVAKLRELFKGKYGAENSKIKVLDLGCGDGPYSLEFALAGYKVTGIDISSKMLKNAKKRPEAKKAAVTFIQGDWNEYLKSIKNEYHTIICAGNSLHHNPLSYLSNFFPLCYQALKPSGTLIINSRDYSRETGENVASQAKGDLFEIFQEMEIPDIGKRNVLKSMFRNIVIEANTTKISFYTYSNYKKDRRTFHCHIIETGLSDSDAGKMHTVSTEVYYLYKDEIMGMLRNSGFTEINGNTGLDSSKSWYLTATKA